MKKIIGTARIVSYLCVTGFGVWVVVWAAVFSDGLWPSSFVGVSILAPMIVVWTQLLHTKIKHLGK